MDDVLPMVNNMKAHIARVEAELAQARETIATMAALRLEREKEIARLREGCKPLAEWLHNNASPEWGNAFWLAYEIWNTTLKGSDHD